MPTVPQMPLPTKSQVEPGQETASNISEMRGSFRQAAAETSTRIMKKTFGSLFSALRFRDKQEDYSAETRRNLQSVSDSIDDVNDKVSYAVNILQDINVSQNKIFRVWKEILDGLDKRNGGPDPSKLPKTLLNLLKIAGLAGLAMARSRIGGLAARTMLGAGGAEVLNQSDDAIKKNIVKIDPMKPEDLSPKTEESDGGGDDSEENDSAPELTRLANEYEKFVIDETKEENKVSGTTTEITDNKSTVANFIPQQNTENTLTPTVTATAVGKENVTATAPAANVSENANTLLQSKNNVDAASKLTRSLVFSSDTITFSADEIEFIQKKIENIKSEEIEKLTDLDAEDDHKKAKKDESRDGSPAADATGPMGGGPAGKNPGNGSSPFDGQLNPELGEIRTSSGLTTQVAKNMVPKFQGFVNDLESTGYKIRELGGYANRRNVNNPSQWSSHAYGAAIDINASTNPNQTRQTDMPKEQVQNLIQKHGLGWGLNWTSVGDPMHFSAMPNEGGTGSPLSTTTPDQGGAGGATGMGSSGGGSSATPVGKESATSGAIGDTSSTPSSKTTTPSSSATPSTTPTAPEIKPTPPVVDMGYNIEKMSQNVSPLRPRASMDQILNQMAVPQKEAPPGPGRSFLDSTNSITKNPSNAGNVEPADANKRMTELFGDYSNFGNVGSLG